MDNLDYSLKRRNDFLQSNDLEKLMKDFKESKEKSSVKIAKPKQQQISQSESMVEEYKPTAIGKANVRKKKDVISLDLPMMGMIKPAPEQPEKESIFGQSFNYMPEDYYDREVIDKETGLPKVFVISNEIKEKIQTMQENKKMPQANSLAIEPHTSKEKELSEIEKENTDKISKMTIQEIKDYQKEIEIKLPTSLLSKLKSGKFHQKIQKELNSIAKDSQSTLIKPSTSSSPQSNPPSKEANLLSSSSLQAMQCQMPYYNYLGLKQIKEVSETLSSFETSGKIDFTQSTFNEMELNNKYYSLLELYNFLCSSNDNQIIFGLKILIKLIPKEIDNDPELVKQLYSFINALFYLIEHRNINVKQLSALLLSHILDYFFKEDIQLCMRLAMYYCLFPVIVINTLPMNSKQLNDLKQRVALLIANCSGMDFIQMIEHCLNKELKGCFCNIALYVYSFCGYAKIKRDMSRLLTNETMIENETLMTICLVYSSREDIVKMKAGCFEQAKEDRIKLVYLYISLLKGVSIGASEINDLLKKDYHSTKSKVIRVNCLFKLGESIPSHLYLGETNYVLLANSLLALIKHSSTHENSPMFCNESQLKFFKELYHSSFSFHQSSSDYKTKLSIYAYWNAVFTLYIKAFQYPKMVNYSKLIDLADILKLFPLLSKDLNEIVESLNRNGPIARSKVTKAQQLYKYEIVLIASLSFIRCFVKRYEPEYNQLQLGHFFMQLSQLINVHCEHLYLKFIKYFKVYFYKKYSSLKGEALFPFISYSKIDEDLNFYLNSNEDLRRSTLLKQLMHFKPDSGPDLPLCLEEEEQQKAIKYFPFDNNFIYQVIESKQAQSEMKLNYLTIVIIVFHNERRKEEEWFEVYLKALVAFNSGDLVKVDYAKVVFEKYVHMMLFKDEIGDEVASRFRLKGSESNKETLDMFFSAFEAITTLEQLELFYKSVVVILIFLHSHSQANCEVCLKPYIYSKNLADVLYQHYYNLLLEKHSFGFLSNKEKGIRSKVLSFLMKNVHISNIDFYEVMIMNYLKYHHFNKDAQTPLSIIADYSIELLSLFSIKANDYVQYLNDTPKLRNALRNKLLPSIK